MLKSIWFDWSCLLKLTFKYESFFFCGAWILKFRYIFLSIKNSQVELSPLEILRSTCWLRTRLKPHWFMKLRCVKLRCVIHSRFKENWKKYYSGSVFALQNSSFVSFPLLYLPNLWWGKVFVCFIYVFQSFLRTVHSRIISVSCMLKSWKSCFHCHLLSPLCLLWTRSSCSHAWFLLLPFLG